MDKKNILANLFSETKEEILKSEASFRQFLTTMQNFHKYKASDLVYFYNQKPNATHIADYDTWAKIGRHVRYGEKGISVLRYNDGSVKIKNYFDVSQTSGKEIVFPDYSLTTNEWKKFLDGEIQDSVNEIAYGTSDMLIQKLAIKIGLAVTQTKSVGTFSLDDRGSFTDADLKILNDNRTFIETLELANEIHRFLSKELLVYKETDRRRDFEHELQKEHERTVDTRNRVSGQSDSWEIRTDSSKQTRRERPRRISNKTIERGINDLRTPDRETSLGQNQSIPEQTGSKSSNIESNQWIAGEDSIDQSNKRSSDRISSGRHNKQIKLNDTKKTESLKTGDSVFFSENTGASLEMGKNILEEPETHVVKDEQASNIQLSEKEISEELDLFIKRGTGTVGGKERVYNAFLSDLSRTKKAAFLKEEYGDYGSSWTTQKSDDFSMFSSGPSGIEFDYTLNKTTGETKKIQFKWSVVAKRLDELIQSNSYLTEEEQESFGRERSSVLKEISLFEFENDDFSDDFVKSESEPQNQLVPGPLVESNAQTWVSEEIKNKSTVSLSSSSKGGSFEFPTDKEFYKLKPLDKIVANIDAIGLSLELKEQDRLATDEEKNILGKYVGWGGLAKLFDPREESYEVYRQRLRTLVSETTFKEMRESILTSYYTDPKIIHEIYKKLEDMGFKGGRVLDPSMGTGNFFSAMPKEMKNNSELIGVELDSLTAQIASQLHGDTQVYAQGFETVDFKDKSFDLVVGNVPFNDYRITDKKYAKNYYIHDYFLKKSIDLVRDGGIVAVIISTGTMDKLNSNFKNELAETANLLGAVRLPDNAFRSIAGTDVTTDILFFKKEVVPKIEQKWRFTGMADDIPTKPFNQYYVQNRQQILGELIVKNFRGGVLSVKSKTDEPLEMQLRRALDNFEGTFSPKIEELPIIEEERNSPSEDLKKTLPVAPYTFSLTEGTLVYNDGTNLEIIKDTSKNYPKIRLYLQIRDSLLTIVTLQRASEFDNVVFSQELKKLNTVYDTFYKRYGSIDKNSRIFEKDDYSPLVRSIEKIESDGSVSKQEVFYKPTIRKIDEITEASNAYEALQHSLNEKLCVDLNYMNNLYAIGKEELLNELKGRIFLDPTYYHADKPLVDSEWLSRDEYLTGDVKTKLEIAEKYAESYPNEFKENVIALKEVQPTPLKTGEIDFSLGATWIPKEVYQDFMYDIFKPRNVLRENNILKIEFDKYSNRYFISSKSSGSNAITQNKFGSKRMDGYQILEASLNLQKVEVRDRMEEDGKTKYVINPKETDYARTKQDELILEFNQWILKHTDTLEKLRQLYNEKFNRTVLRKYDGSKLTFRGLNKFIEPRPAQKNIVQRILTEGKALMAHAVGAGKTLSMISAGMMMKEYGIIKKPLYVVPNHLTGDFGLQLLSYYPSKKVLITTEKDFQKNKRKQFVSRIATGEYDAIIMGHSQFEKIGLSTERQRKMLNEEIEELSNAVAEYRMSSDSDDDSWSIKQMVSFEKKLQERLEKLNKQDKKDKLLDFEDLGVDFLFVDEAHVYKNLYSYTKLSNVAGVNSSNSLRASDMEMKVKYMLEKYDNRGVVFATGTPVSNSMSEMYTMMKYLQPEVLRQADIYHFDSWASTFGEIISSLEITPEGTGYQIKNRFSKFHNLPELMVLFNRIADIQTKEMLDLPVPKIKGEKAQIVVVEPIRYQKDKVEELADRAALIRSGSVDSSSDNMLKITNEARLMALDPRLLNDYDPEKYDSSDLKYTKIAACVDKVYQIWKETIAQKSTQMIFSDSGTPKIDKFDVYNEMKEQLIVKGIPEEEIAFVHDAKNSKQREELFEKMRAGTLRIMFGSTSKVGTGTNVQNKLIAAHHIDCPWRPSDIEQRDGRIVRQGNENEEVQIYHYVTKSTFDSYLWQIQEQKLTYISQVMSGNAISRSVDELSETVLDASEIKAIATGNPLIAEKMKLDNEITRLRLLQSSFLNEKDSLRIQVESTIPQHITLTKNEISSIKKDLEKFNPIELDEFKITLNGHLFTDRKLASEEMERIVVKNKHSSDFQDIGNYSGVELKIRKSELNYGQYEVRLVGEQHYSIIIDPTTPTGMIRRIENIHPRLEKKLAEKEKGLDLLKEQLNDAIEQMDGTFPFSEELREKTEKQKEIQREIEYSLENKDADRTIKERTKIKTADIHQEVEL